MDDHEIPIFGKDRFLFQIFGVTVGSFISLVQVMESNSFSRAPAPPKNSKDQKSKKGGSFPLQKKKHHSRTFFWNQFPNFQNHREGQAVLFSSFSLSVFFLLFGIDLFAKIVALITLLFTLATFLVNFRGRDR
jgi:hypothetical protein